MNHPHLENLLIFGVCTRCGTEWALGTGPKDKEEALKFSAL